MQHQRVLLGRRVGEVPDLVLGERLGLGMDAELLIEGQEHCAGGVAPRCRLL